jgi:hypothetical protein
MRIAPSERVSASERTATISGAADLKLEPRLRLDMIRFRDGAQVASESPRVSPSAAAHGELHLRRTGPQ